MKKCSIEGCLKTATWVGLCSIHYSRKKVHGDPNILLVEKHGMCKSSEYNIFKNIKRRCLNPNNSQYHNYGGRGISICEDWKNSFLSFFADMGKKPFPTAQLDRIDNNGNYEPNNCRWTTPAINSRNKRTTILTESDVKYMRESGIKAKDLAVIYKCNVNHIHRILKGKKWKQN